MKAVEGACHITKNASPYVGLIMYHFVVRLLRSALNLYQCLACY